MNKDLNEEIKKLFDDGLDEWDSQKEAIEEAFRRGVEYSSQ